MKRNARNAYKALVKIGAPVMEEPWNNGYFRISGETNYQAGEFGGNKVVAENWADYYNENGSDFDFGVNPKINKILDKYGLYCEWQNPGVMDVYDVY